MKKVQRTLQKRIEQYANCGKAILLVGPRQVGKSTLFRQITDNQQRTLWLNCDQQETRNALSNASLSDLRLLVGGNRTVVIDEAQRVANIGLTLKLLNENFKNLQLLVTGSSSLDLHNRLNEPLTGRKMEYKLYPIAAEEIYNAEGLVALREQLSQRLIYGSYPEVIYGELPPEKVLGELTESYLYKDILEMDGLRKPALLQKLLVAIALQIGSEVSYNEIAKTIGADCKTVERYIDVLEKCFIIFRLNSYKRNIRTELSKGKKIYFYDLGVRNAILNNFAPLENRNDVGALWENYFIVERMKRNHYADYTVNMYFWRTSDKQEIDYIEERNGQLQLFEMKWNAKRTKTKIPNLFIETYHPEKTAIVTPENYLDFLLNCRGE